MGVLFRPWGYSKVDKEDPEELVHRRAQFLIYKALRQADSITKRPSSSVRIRFRRLSLRLGCRLKKLRKTVLVVGVSAARFSVYKRVISLLKTWRLLFIANGAKAAAIPSGLLISGPSSIDDHAL